MAAEPYGRRGVEVPFRPQTDQRAPLPQYIRRPPSGWWAAAHLSRLGLASPQWQR